MKKKISRQISPIEEAFFAFLYAVSCAWMLFILIDSSYQHRKLPVFKYSLLAINRRPSCPPAKPRSSVGKSRRKTVFSASALRSARRRSNGSCTLIPRRKTFHTNNYDYMYNKRHPTGGLFIRTGLGIFCLGSAIHSSLKLIRNVYFDNCDELIRLLDNVLYIVFSFIQYLFLFKRSNLVIKKMIPVAHVGALHVVVTNFCVWIKQIIIETRFNIVHEDPECLAQLRIKRFQSL
ncbi:hypothetical protein ACOME3_010041 [Neoechinorhynchus agilis]